MVVGVSHACWRLPGLVGCETEMPNDASIAADTAAIHPPAAPTPASADRSPHSPRHPPANPRGRRLAVLTLTALGVVYGDIGTSPLYTVRETFSTEHGLAPNVATVYGILSLVCWSLILVVAVKYLVFILRADNRGEGGVLALLALALQRQHPGGEQRRRTIYIVLGVFGTALLYGDGVITPAISVLGAVEGLEVVTPALGPFVVGITVFILLGLFMFQKRGTSGVGKLFGPVTLVWFLTIGVL